MRDFLTEPENPEFTKNEGMDRRKRKHRGTKRKENKFVWKNIWRRNGQDTIQLCLKFHFSLSKCVKQKSLSFILTQ